MSRSYRAAGSPAAFRGRVLVSENHSTGRVRRPAILAAFFALLVANCGLAGDAIDPGKIELYPTYTAVGIEFPYSGDDNGDATAEFVWRTKAQAARPSGAWRNGVDVTFDRKKRFIWASIWPLEQGETVEVEFTVKDPQSPGLKPIRATATTKRLFLATSGGRTFYVSPEGSNDNPGTKDRPFKTLAHAASQARPSDTVYALSGTYYEGDLCAGLVGEPGKPIVFAAAEGHKPRIDGSVEIKKGAAWRGLEDDVYVTDFAPETKYVGYVAQDGKRMYLFRSLKEMRENEFKVGRAWHYDAQAGRIYVRTGDDVGPQGHAYKIAVREYGVLLSDSRHVVVRGFDMGYFGQAVVRLSEGATGCVVADNAIHNAPCGLFVKGASTRDNAVWRNEIYERGLLDFSWSAIKRSGYARQGVAGWAGRGTSVCHNTIHGYFDGLAPVSWKHPDDLHINRDYDMMYNRFLNIGDDAIEADGGGVNMRIHGNRIRNCFVAISLAPIERGPTYCTRNHATYMLLMFKLNVAQCTSLGWAYSYHNSGYCLTAAKSYGGTAVSFPPGGGIPISNKVFKNNAFICDGMGIRNAHSGYAMDYDCYYPVPGKDAVKFQWQVKGPEGKWKKQDYRTIEEFRDASGREIHGMYADPQFLSTPGLGALIRQRYSSSPFSLYPLATDTSAGDLHLKSTSPCIDKGVVIRGVNDGHKGKAPDIGAFEFDPAP